MKRLLVFLSAMALMTALAIIPISAASEIYYDGTWHTYQGNTFGLKIDGQTLSCSVPPIVFNDYSVVPARDVFERLGARVDWLDREQKVTVVLGDTGIILYINKLTAYKNGTEYTMPIAPKIINGKTMIPVRFVAESLGYDVAFDATTDTISITTSGKTSAPDNTTNTGSTEEPPAAAAGVTLQSYKYEEKNGAFTIKLTLSGTDMEQASFALENPDRIVVDLGNVKGANSIQNAEVISEMVTGLRFGQHGAVLRLVCDLKSPQPYSVKRSGKTVTVTIGTSQTEEPEEVGGVNTEEETKEPEIPLETIEAIAPSRSITIDPGHGGTDPGAIFTEEDGTVWEEADINLAVSLKVRDILQAQGVRVVMTRTTDTYVVRKERPLLANEEQTALFLSIHTNAVEGENKEKANGIETWGSLVTGYRPSGGVTDKILAQNIQDAVIKQTKATNRGIKDSTNLTVLVYSDMPSALVEVGFITNETERVNLFTESYRDKLAAGIAEGILKTFEAMGV